MLNKKKLITKIGGLGEIEIELLETGEDKWLKEIEDFVLRSEQRFIAIIMFKPELNNVLYFQRALQAFLNHLQMGGEYKPSNDIRKHFKNWIVSQNGSLQKIISADGHESNNGSNTAKTGTSNDRMEAARKW